MDETYVKVGGRWCYLYRAIDRAGNLVDCRLSETRDMAAAKAFFRGALQPQVGLVAAGWGAVGLVSVAVGRVLPRSLRSLAPVFTFMRGINPYEKSLREILKANPDGKFLREILQGNP